jgi:hypothetical protein
MKLNLLKIGVVAMMVVSAFVSCESDEIPVLTDEALTLGDISAIEEVHGVMEEINSDVEQAFIVEEAIGTLTSKEGDSKITPNFFPECLTKTVVREENMKIVTLDYGEGCEIRGKLKSGILIMSYEKNTELHSRTITVTYDNFKVNRKLMEGSHSVVRVKENENGFPQNTSTFDVTVTWDNGDTASRKGVKVKEMIEGADTRVWSDNVYSITGNWETTRKNGIQISAEVTTTLRRELVCKFLVSGEMYITKNDSSGSLNYGDGTCDNMANLTLDDGTVIEITLHKKYKN